MNNNLPEHDLIIVGAGFAGIFTAIHAEQRGLRVLGIEAAEDVGGTWYWNRYPGARCDVESIDYSYSFDPQLEQDWRWSERYATQPEILKYLNFVADRYNVRRLFTFNERVNHATWDQDQQLWRVETDSGVTTTARWFVMATGPLSAPILPEIPGRDTFAGEIYQTSDWPTDEPNFTDKRVGIVGTGSSGIQVIPEIARTASSVHVYQRTANYSVPAFNRELDDAEWMQEQTQLQERRRASWAGGAGSPWTSHTQSFEDLDAEARELVFSNAWNQGGVLFAKAFERQTIDPVINDAARVFFEERLQEIVKDPQTLSDLTPQGHPIGTKRICTDSGYYETFNEPHVHLHNLQRTPITEVTSGGIHTSEGFQELDCIVYATGFDAMTGALTAIDIYGRDGRLLRDEWSAGHRTLVGVGIPGFPNLLSLNGPGSPSVFANMALTSEQQGTFALDLIEYCNTHQYHSCEARDDAADAWTQHSQEMAHGTLFGSSASWYTGANIEGKAPTFLPYPGGFANYNAKAAEIAKNHYEGFVFTEKSSISK